MKQYGVIICDPPWKYRNRGGNGAAENHYPTMTTKALMQLPVRRLAAPDCVLFLWATWPQLEVALRLVSAWDFRYITGLPWVKVTDPPQIDLTGALVARPAMGTGFWVRGCSEPILICRRGHARPPRPGDRYLGLLAERLEHSRKPDDIHDLAEVLPGPYVELFARRPRPGWDVWGNEVDNAVELEE